MRYSNDDVDDNDNDDCNDDDDDCNDDGDEMYSLTMCIILTVAFPNI